ncbi:MAG: hypothetical protein AAFP84_01645 [Actinomycetota bacterium]
MQHVTLTLLIVVANVLGAGMAFPQALRLARTRRTDGVSGVWAGISIAMNGWWLVYGVAERLWGLVPTSAVAAVIYVFIAVTIVRVDGGAARRSTVGRLVLGLGLGTAPLPFLALGGWPVAGIAIGLGYGLQLLPAVIAAYRSRELGGIAPGTWIMAWIESAIWVVYGVVVVDPALLVGGTSGVVFPTLLLARLAVTGHRPFRLPARVTRPAWSIG